MTLYLAGPMRGVADLNYPAFDAAAEALRKLGHEVFNPAEHDAGCPDLDDLGHYLAHDLPAVCRADCMAVLGGWEHSSGATIEAFVAVTLGHPVYTVADLVAGKTECLYPELVLKRVWDYWCVWPAPSPWVPAPGAPPEATGSEQVGETVLEEAIRLTSRDRQGAYGPPGEHFSRTVAGLNARFCAGRAPLFARPMTPQEWPLMILIDKLIGRGQDTREMKRDSLVDVCGYARTWEMVGEAVEANAEHETRRVAT